MAKQINIQHFRSANAGNIPSAADLQEGEIAINMTDRKLFSKDASNTVFEFVVGAAGTAFTIFDFTTHLSLANVVADAGTDFLSLDAANGVVFETNSQSDYWKISMSQDLSVNGSPSFSSNVLIKGDLSTSSSFGSAPHFAVTGNTDPNKRTYLGFNVTDNYGFIGASQVGTSDRLLAIQPEGTDSGGQVSIGKTTATSLLDVDGVITSLGLMPAANNTYSIGNSTIRWANGFFDVLNVANVTTTQNNLQVDAQGTAFALSLILG